MNPVLTGNRFERRGFSECSMESLPEEKRKKINRSRGSKCYMKTLQPEQGGISVSGHSFGYSSLQGFCFKICARLERTVQISFYTVGGYRTGYEFMEVVHYFVLVSEFCQYQEYMLKQVFQSYLCFTLSVITAQECLYCMWRGVKTSKCLVVVPFYY